MAIQAAFLPVEMTMARLNERCSVVPAFTLRYRAIPDKTETARIEELVARNGGTIAWQQNPQFERTYALIEGVDAPLTPDMGPAIIALAVRPSTPEALSKLEEALGGRGRPSGMSACERVGEALVLEWNQDVTSAHIILELCDIELARYHASRTNTLLSPVPLAWWTSIAGNGLIAPEIAPNRVLEALIEERHVPH